MGCVQTTESLPRLPEHLEGPKASSNSMMGCFRAESQLRPDLWPPPQPLPSARGGASPPRPTRGPQTFLNPPVRSSLPHTLLCMENTPAPCGPDTGLRFCWLTGARGFQGPEGAIPATLCLYGRKVKSEPSSEAVPFGVPNYAASYPRSWSLSPAGVSLRRASNRCDGLLHHRPKIP